MNYKLTMYMVVGKTPNCS